VGRDREPTGPTLGNLRLRPRSTVLRPGARSERNGDQADGASDAALDATSAAGWSETQQLRAVAVLSHVLWETGVTDAIYFSGHVSATNKQRIAELIYQGVTNVSVTFAFVVYAFDQAGQPAVYARCFHSDDAALQGVLEKHGEDLSLSIADDPSDEVPSPRNFVFQLGVKPFPAAQVLHLAAGAGRTLAKPWGFDPV
jgi:hypothetical protein